MRIKCNIEVLVISSLNLKLTRGDTATIDDNIARNCVELKKAIRLKQILVLRFKETEQLIRVEQGNNKDDEILELKKQIEEQNSKLQSVIASVVENTNNSNLQILKKIENLTSNLSNASPAPKNIDVDDLVSKISGQLSSLAVKSGNADKIPDMVADLKAEEPIIKMALEKDLKSNIKQINVQKTKSKKGTRANLEALKKMKDENEGV